MSTPPGAFKTETVVQLVKYQRTVKSEPLTSKGLSCSKPIALKDRLEYQASIEIDELPWLHAQFSTKVRNELVKNVRDALDKEFGKLRVYRYRRLFVVRHKSMETLIAGLLRAQFHTHQLVLPETNVFGDSVEQKGVSIIWGVGRNGLEAESERLKRRRQKNYPR